MVEEQNELKLEIGTEEATSLKPANVKIENVEIKPFGEKKSNKVVCYAKHPDKDDLIQISEVKYENKGKLEVAGLWINKDSKGKIRKGSALATFLNSQKVKTIEGLKGKEVGTVLDENGYLCFKAY